MNALSGGYTIHRVEPILASAHRHSAGLPGQPLSAADLSATNSLMATGWRIERRVLDIARDLLCGELPSTLIPGDALEVVPSRLTDADWSALSAEGRREHRSRLAAIHESNNTLLGRRTQFLDAVESADEMVDIASFWFVWNHDFRFRRYVVACGGLNPQGSDFQKSLLIFAEGKEVGAEGLGWLYVRAANCFGVDKVSLEERREWVLNHAQQIIAVAADPLDTSWWSLADEPWQFLATCLELADAWALDNPFTFVSHLPVMLDGSTNGLQHLSALGADPVGAKATNLYGRFGRQDIYLTVAFKAAERVERDAADGVAEAMAWLGHIGRPTVKRAVMTTPYGVTAEGIRRQLVDDDLLPRGTGHSAMALSRYMRDVLIEAISDTVVGAKRIMAWMQEVAGILASYGLPMEWTTPTGSRCRQEYLRQHERRVQTLVGNLSLIKPGRAPKIDKRKQQLGAAPQVVHSLDAAHSALTINEVVAQGVNAVVTIHDSFGTHAADTCAMFDALRTTFVAIYSEDWLAKLHADFQEQAPEGVTIPAPPQRGRFNIQSVLDSEFFFS